MRSLAMNPSLVARRLSWRHRGSRVLIEEARAREAVAVVAVGVEVVFKVVEASKAEVAMASINLGRRKKRR